MNILQMNKEFIVLSYNFQKPTCFPAPNKKNF